MKTILYDLDGTLTDSGEGIMKCANLALSRYGLDVPDYHTLGVFVGPPLKDTFKKSHIPDEEIDNAIALFRQRYLTVGKFENHPYEGIKDLLARLQSEGYKQCVATSKPEQTAREILEHFDMTRYFDVICGASYDHSREDKDAVIRYLLEQTDAEDAVMIGDTKFDMIGAAKFNIPAIGVSWGFGSKEELIRYGAAKIVHTPAQLYQAILSM